jgi:hypothetical protein
MLTIPSTHLVVIAFDDTGERVSRFCDKVGRTAQISVLLGSHFGDLKTLADNYLPKPAVDYISTKQTQLLKNRGVSATEPNGDGTTQGEGESADTFA